MSQATMHRLLVKQAHKLIASKIGALRARLPDEAEQVDQCRQNHAAILGLLPDGLPR